MKAEKRRKRAKAKKKAANIERANNLKETQEGKKVYQNFVKRTKYEISHIEAKQRYKSIVEAERAKDGSN